MNRRGDVSHIHIIFHALKPLILLESLSWIDCPFSQVLSLVAGVLLEKQVVLSCPNLVSLFLFPAFVYHEMAACMGSEETLVSSPDSCACLLFMCPWLFNEESISQRNMKSSYYQIMMWSFLLALIWSGHIQCRVFCQLQCSLLFP